MSSPPRGIPDSTPHPPEETLVVAPSSTAPEEADGLVGDRASNLTDLPPHIQETIAPVITAFRWGALAYGVVFGLAEIWTDSSTETAVGLVVCLTLTVWRTIRPIKLGSSVPVERFALVLDTLVFGLAVGYSGASSSPFIFCVVAAMVVAGFGWGYFAGFISISVSWMAMAAGAAVSPERDAALSALIDRDASLVLVTMAAVTFLAAFAHSRLVESERRRRRFAGQIDTLSETNDLLTKLNRVARTLPTSLNQRDALASARTQVDVTFGPTTMCLFERAGDDDEWTPKLTEGCAFGPALETAELPEPLSQALGRRHPVLVADIAAVGIEPVGTTSASGLYSRLVARGRTVGVLAVEHTTSGRYGEHDRQLMAGLGDVLALTLDNARSYGRLRSLGAEMERNRIARDLHDRLGQWMTYISIELERIRNAQGDPSGDLERLHSDVGSALDELRDTLRQLRSEITPERPLALVGREMTSSFSERSGVPATWTATDGRASLSVPIENELLRILQESLNNVDRHAGADHVDVTWEVSGGEGTLTVRDDGRGFEPARGIRESAYGLVGMRERADVIGARLTIDSAPGQGTAVTVRVSSYGNDKDGT